VCSVAPNLPPASQRHSELSPAHKVPWEAAGGRRGRGREQGCGRRALEAEQTQQGGEFRAPSHDALGLLPPSHNALGLLPSHDALGLPPSHDALGLLPPSHDALGLLPPSHNALGDDSTIAY